MNAQNENIRFPRDTFSLDLLFADSFTIHSCSLSANKTWRVMEACKSGITFMLFLIMGFLIPTFERPAG